MLREAPRDPAALREMLHADIEWDAGSLHLLGATDRFQGADGVMEFFRQWVSAFSEWSYEVDEVFAPDDDHVIAEIHQSGTGKASGARVEQHFWQVWTLRDGKAIRGTNHETREAAVAAARATG